MVTACQLLPLLSDQRKLADHTHMTGGSVEAFTRGGGIWWALIGHKRTSWLLASERQALGGARTHAAGFQAMSGLRIVLAS